MQDEADAGQGGTIRSAAKRKALAFLCAMMAVVATVCYTIGMINATGPRSMTFVALFIVLAIYFLYKGVRLYTAVDEQEHARQVGSSGGPRRRRQLADGGCRGEAGGKRRFHPR